MKKIMLVEDDPGVRDSARLILERAGYHVIVLEDGEILLGDNYELPDIFILDKQLSGVDGLDICKYLKKQQHTKHIPVIMLSANPHIGILAKDAGADNALEKPFRMQALREMVAAYT